jgi:hypothetical protein
MGAPFSGAGPGRVAACALLLLALLASAPAAAETLRVGPGERFALPSQAAAAARDGDTVLIAAGRYADCAVWRAARLTVAAEGPVEISGPVCDGKALFVAAGPGLVLEDIAFRGAASPDDNGAGVRAEGGDLTVRRARFEDNQAGILTRAEMPGATLLVEDSVFLRNGAPSRFGHACGGHALYAGHLALVAIRRSRFQATRVCHHVKSRAARTEVTGSLIEDGPEGGASYLVDLPNGGDLLLADSTLAKGPRSGNPRAAVVIGAEGVRLPTRSLRVEANRFVNRAWLPTIFVENRSGTPAELVGNTVDGFALPLLGPGRAR